LLNETSQIRARNSYGKEYGLVNDTPEEVSVVSEPHYGGPRIIRALAQQVETLLFNAIQFLNAK
jgi:hypothetical protein